MGIFPVLPSRRGLQLSANHYATDYHAPVLVEEVLEQLGVRQGARIVDGTAGGGGHSQAILDASGPDGQLLAIDRDPEAVQEVRERLHEYGDRVTVIQGNYSKVPRILDELGWEPVDGWLVDAGVSSHQLDDPERGFSFREGGPLDMRMGPDTRSLAELFEEIDATELARIFYEYGEVRGSRPLARWIYELWEQGKLQDTADLAAAVQARRPRRHDQSIHPATLVFQALRIAVNRELEHLEEAVEAIPRVVRPGGRAVFISFHSLEDRIIKHGFRRLEDPCTCPPDFPVCGCGAISKGKVITKRPLVASQEELQRNPRARSAKLRAFAVAHP